MSMAYTYDGMILHNFVFIFKAVSLNIVTSDLLLAFLVLCDIVSHKFSAFNVKFTNQNCA